MSTNNCACCALPIEVHNVCDYDRGCSIYLCPYDSKEKASGECINYTPTHASEPLARVDSIEETNDGIKIRATSIGDKLKAITDEARDSLANLGMSLNAAVQNGNPEEPDMVNHPPHYTAGGIECIDALEAAVSSHTDPIAAGLTWQCIKYLWRWPLKNGLEDLKKTQFYLERLIRHVEEEESE